MGPVCTVPLYRLGGPPHPPQSLESLGWACFGPQNLDVKDLTHQNLDSKGLRGGTMWVHPTVTTSAMITRFSFGRKVRCHTGAVEMFASDLLHLHLPKVSLQYIW